MKFVTTYTKYNSDTGQFVPYVKIIEAISWEDAEYQISLDPCLEMVGLLVEEIDEETGDKTNYENLN